MALYLPLIAPHNVTRVYSGLPGCTCGCRGNYTDNKSTITRFLKLYEMTPPHRISFYENDEESFVYWDNVDESRTYTIYFKKGDVK